MRFSLGVTRVSSVARCRLPAKNECSYLRCGFVRARSETIRKQMEPLTRRCLSGPTDLRRPLRRRGARPHRDRHSYLGRTPPAVLRRSRRVRPLAGRSSGDREGGRSAGRGSCIASFCDAVEASRRAPDIRSARRSPNPRPTRRRVGDFLPRVAAVGSLVHVAPSVCGEANRRGDASRVTRGGRALTVPPRLRSSPGACGRFPASSGSSR